MPAKRRFLLSACRAPGDSWPQGPGAHRPQSLEVSPDQTARRPPQAARVPGEGPRAGGRAGTRPGEATLCPAARLPGSWGPAGTQRQPRRAPRRAGGARAVTPMAAAEGTGGEGPGWGRAPRWPRGTPSSHLHVARCHWSLTGPRFPLRGKQALKGEVTSQGHRAGAGRRRGPARPPCHTAHGPQYHSASTRKLPTLHIFSYKNSRFLCFHFAGRGGRNEPKQQTSHDRGRSVRAGDAAAHGRAVAAPGVPPRGGRQAGI